MLKKFLKLSAGGISLMAAAIAIWEWATQTTVNDSDDVIEAIEQVRKAIERNEDFDFDPEEFDQVQNALSTVTDQITRNSSVDVPSYLRVASGVFTLEVGQSADVEIPGKGFASIGYIGDDTPSDPSIRVNFQGTGNNRIGGGHVFEVSNDPFCSLLFVGPSDGQGSPAVFRFRCTEN